MDTSIITKVSEIILENRLGYKIPSRKRDLSGQGDSVQISPVASEVSQIAKALDQQDQERAQKVESLKARIADRGFELPDEMMEAIASNIAKMFI